jgi:glycine cleavage system H protein
MSIPADLHYTKDHEWVRVSEDGTTCTIGITHFAQSELGDIVYLEIDELDNDVDKDGVFGTVEAVKTVSELFMPVSGTVSEFNENLEDSPELVNDDPYGEGWIVKVTMSEPDQVTGLLTADDYADVIGG